MSIRVVQVIPGSGGRVCDIGLYFKRFAGAIIALMNGENLNICRPVDTVIIGVSPIAALSYQIHWIAACDPRSSTV
jgi:hypothetical protein